VSLLAQQKNPFSFFFKIFDDVVSNFFYEKQVFIRHIKNGIDIYNKTMFTANKTFLKLFFFKLQE